MSNLTKKALLTPEFLIDLELAHQMLEERQTPKTEYEFIGLEESLQNAHKDSLKRSVHAHAAYKHSHPNSPLFESVSLFEPMGFERLEPALTRTLAWLLDANKPHGLGTSFLAALLKLLFANSNDVPSMEMASRFFIRSEWQINKACRIDIAITDQTRDWIILIEAKIDAHERLGQLNDYYEAAKTAGFRKIHGIYLTTEQSKKTTDIDGHWHHMLYDEIAGELLKLLDADSDGKNSVHPLVGYFVTGLLRDVCGWHTNRDAVALLKSVNCFEFEVFAERYFQ